LAAVPKPEVGNDAWPAKYLFDDRGRLVRRWIGEGSYDESELEIRRLLAAAHPASQLPTVTELASTFAKTRQPSYAGITNETYIGAERREPGAVTLKGDWHTDRQFVELKTGSGEIVVPFVSGEVNLVMQPGPSGRASVSVLLDGKPIVEARGTDVGVGRAPLLGDHAQPVHRNRSDVSPMPDTCVTGDSAEQEWRTAVRRPQWISTPQRSGEPSVVLPDRRSRDDH
jgi:hypothetical protein